MRPAGRKQASVLAALLLSPGRVVPEDRLIDLTWGEQAPRSARGRLQVHVSDLRKLLGADVIVRGASGYSIEIGPGERDLDVFDAVVAQARSLTGEAAITRLRDALDLWTGAPLDGVSDELAELERPALVEHRLAVVQELHELRIAEGQHTEAVADLRKLVDEHPYRERLRAALMLALHRCGRTGEALEVYSAGARSAGRRARHRTGTGPARDAAAAPARRGHASGHHGPAGRAPPDRQGFRRPHDRTVRIGQSATTACG